MFSNVSPCTSLYDLVFSRIPCTPMHPLYNHVFPCIYMYPHLFPCTHDCLIYPPILPHNPLYAPVSLVLSCVHLYSYLFYFVLTVPPVFLFTTCCLIYPLVNPCIPMHCLPLSSYVSTFAPMYPL